MFVLNGKSRSGAVVENRIQTATSIIVKEKTLPHVSYPKQIKKQKPS